MLLIKYLIIILSISLFLTKKLNVKKENSIILSNFLIFVLLYIFGILNILKYGVYAIFLITVIIIIYLIYLTLKRQIELNDFININTIIYVLGMIYIYWFTKNTNFTEWDEFSHWGTNLKAMVFKDILWSNNQWDGIHVAYPPLSGIIEYFGCKLYGIYSEWVAFFALDSFILAIITPVFKERKFNISNFLKSIIYLICIYLIIYIFNFKLNSVYIDLPLGILFFIGLYYAFNDEKKMVFLILFILPLFKDTGLIFDAIILLYLFIKDVILEIIKDKKISKKHIRKIFSFINLLVIVFSGYLSYKIYCNINGTKIDFIHDSNNIIEFNSNEYLKAITLNDNLGKAYDITVTFYDFLNKGTIIDKFPFQTIIQLIVVLNILGFILYKLKINKEKIISMWCALDIGIIIYLLFLLLIFIYAFLEREGRILASIQRYASTYFIAWFFLIITIIFNKKGFKNILIILFICIYGTDLLEIIIPKKNQKVIPQIAYEISENILKEVDNNEKIFIILQDTDGCMFHQIRYLISPIKTNLLYEWNLGDTNIIENTFTLNISKEEFVKKIKEEKYDYVYLGFINDKFVKEYGSLFDKENIVGLYKIKLSNTITLEKIN